MAGAIENPITSQSLDDNTSSPLLLPAPKHTGQPGTARERKNCLHGKYQPYCKECKGSGLCVHLRHKNRCAICKRALVWPSTPAQPSPLFSRETVVGFILFHAKYLLLSQSRTRRKRHTCVASVCAFLSWAVASCDIAAWGGADKSGTGGVKVCVAASLPRRRDTLKLTWATCFRMVKVLNGTMQ